MQHPDQVLTQQELFGQVWKRQGNPGRTVAMYVAHLRKLLVDRRSNSVIQTVRGAGYIFASAPFKQAKVSPLSGSATQCARPASLRPAPMSVAARGLRPKERGLLELLILNPGKTFSRECIADILWGPATIRLRTVDANVSRLRHVFAQHSLADPIRGVLSKGYQISEACILSSCDL